ERASAVVFEPEEEVVGSVGTGEVEIAVGVEVGGRQAVRVAVVLADEPFFELQRAGEDGGRRGGGGSVVLGGRAVDQGAGEAAEGQPVEGSESERRHLW